MRQTLPDLQRDLDMSLELAFVTKRDILFYRKLRRKHVNGQPIGEVGPLTEALRVLQRFKLELRENEIFLNREQMRELNRCWAGAGRRVELFPKSTTRSYGAFHRSLPRGNPWYISGLIHLNPILALLHSQIPNHPGWYYLNRFREELRITLEHERRHYLQTGLFREQSGALLIHHHGINKRMKQTHSMIEWDARVSALITRHKQAQCQVLSEAEIDWLLTPRVFRNGALYCFERNRYSNPRTGRLYSCTVNHAKHQSVRPYRWRISRKVKMFYRRNWMPFNRD